MRLLKTENSSTKTCPNCGNDKLLLLMSLQLKICTDCDTKITWKLDKGQKTLITSGR